MRSRRQLLSEYEKKYIKQEDDDQNLEKKRRVMRAFKAELHRKNVIRHLEEPNDYQVKLSSLFSSPLPDSPDAQSLN